MPVYRNRIQIPPSFPVGVYQEWNRFAIELRDHNNPSIILFGNINILSPIEIFYDPDYSPDYKKVMAKGIFEAIKSIPNMPAPEFPDLIDQGSNNACTDPTSASPWAGEFQDMGGDDVTFNFLTQTGNPTFPGVNPNEEYDILFRLAYYSYSTPVPFAEDIRNYLAGNDDKFNALTQMYKGFS